MLTIHTVENIKRGSRITYINGIYAVLLGIYYIAAFNWIIKDDLKAIGSVWQVFSKYNPELAMLYIKMFIFQGILIISAGIAIMYLSSYILKKKDKAAWVVLFIIGIIFWPSLLTVELLNKNWYNVVFAFFGWLLFIIGMLIPIRYYLQKSYYEY